MTALRLSPTGATARRVYGLGALAGVLFGYDNGIIAAAILFIPRDLPLTPLQKGMVVSATVVGAMAGSLAGGPAADRLGRKRILMVAGVVFAAGALGAGLAPTVAVLVGFRFVLGIAIGIASVLAPIYLAEMAPARDRGVITSLNQCTIIVGTALAGAIGFGLAFTGAWRAMLLIAVVPAVALIVGLIGAPDTPRSLIRRGHREQGRAVLERLRPDEAGAEFAEIEALEREQPTGRMRVRLSDPWVRRLVLLGTLLAVFQQITGINAVVYYAPTVLTDFGLSDRTALLFGFLNGLLNVVTIVVVLRSKVVDRRGRKPVLLAGLVGMSVALCALGAAACGLPTGSTALLVIAIAAFVLFTNTFSATWGPVLWVVLAEIFPLAVRGTAMAVVIVFTWLTDFFVSLTFPVFTDLVGAGPVFFAYAAAGVVIFPIVWLVVPETKGRSLEALERDFRSGRGPSGGPVRRNR